MCCSFLLRLNPKELLGQPSASSVFDIFIPKSPPMIEKLEIVLDFLAYTFQIFLMSFMWLFVTGSGKESGWSYSKIVSGKRDQQGGVWSRWIPLPWTYWSYCWCCQGKWASILGVLRFFIIAISQSLMFLWFLFPWIKQTELQLVPTML